MDHHEPRSWQEMLCLGTIAIENRLNQEKLEEIGGIALEENWVKERFWIRKNFEEKDDDEFFL